MRRANFDAPFFQWFYFITPKLPHHVTFQVIPYYGQLSDTTICHLQVAMIVFMNIWLIICD